VSSYLLYRLGALDGCTDGTVPDSDLRVGCHDTVMLVHCTSVFCIFQLVTFSMLLKTYSYHTGIMAIHVYMYVT